jgi:hypothetical protein
LKGCQYKSAGSKAINSAAVNTEIPCKPQIARIIQEFAELRTRRMTTGCSGLRQVSKKLLQSLTSAAERRAARPLGDGLLGVSRATSGSDPATEGERESGHHSRNITTNGSYASFC